MIYFGHFCDFLSKDDISDASSKFNGTPISTGISINREEDMSIRNENRNKIWWYLRMTFTYQEVIKSKKEV